MTDDQGNVKPYSNRVWIVLIILTFFILVLRTSWISDDAYITFRSIENFINGYGLTYNIGERVQTYTHPLWMLILSTTYLFTFRLFRLDFPAELPFIALVWSWVFLLVSIGALAYCFKKQKVTFGLAIWLLIASKAFMDFAASGLENPLTYAFIGIFFFYFRQVFTAGKEVKTKELFILSLIAGFSTFNRMDTVLFFLPALILLWFHAERRGKALLYLVVGFSPFVLWEIFSLYYYGFLFPNTAYAKLSSGIAGWSYIKQGLWYLSNSITLDPISLPLILIAGCAGLLVWDRKTTPASIGLLLYLGYTIRIGGDYMSGRFLSTSVFLAIIILMNLEINWRRYSLQLVVGIFALGILGQSLPYASDSSYEDQSIDRNGIANERGFRYQDWGLLRISRNQLLPDSPFAHGQWEYEGIKDLKVSGAIGLEGYNQGPNVHILDIMALADPLLARLPATDPIHWRVGHIERAIPEGYVETLISGQNSLEDPDLRVYYDYLTIVTKGPLWSGERLKTIFDFQLGHHDHYLEAWEGYGK
jgi:arabinofuranosyltransferase